MDALTFIFGNIGYLITGLALITIISCIYTKTPNYFPISLILGAFTAVAWIPEFWNYPKEIASPHTVLAMAAMVTIRGQYSNRIITILVTALSVDVLWAYLQASEVQSILTSTFWHQSILNLLAVSFCLIVLLRCYNPTKDKGLQRGIFYAKHTHQFIRKTSSDQ